MHLPAPLEHTRTVTVPHFRVKLRPSRISTSGLKGQGKCTSEGQISKLVGAVQYCMYL